jgi:ATP-binding cassette subfamily F protein 3
LRSVNLQIERAEKIALVGPNGAGKTTFAKIISNRLEPSHGEIEFGHNTILSFYAQDVVDNLNLENDIITEIAQSDAENTTAQLRSILGAFLFHGDDVFKKIKVLSGGEKSRVALAKVLLAKANTIILDEPTNHLDFESKKIIQDALIKFSGTIIIVSHDIDFLKPIITKVVEVRNNSLKEFYGGIEYYLSKIEGIEEEENLNNKPAQNKLSKKDEKRIEAKRRQEEYDATKQLKEKISSLEEQIELLEHKKNSLESDLMKEEIYSNPDKARATKNDFELTKNDLNRYYEEWTEVSNELEEVLQKFKLD